MRSRTYVEQDLEPPAPPLDLELAELICHQPQEVCGVLGPLLSDERKERIEAVLEERVRSLVLVLDHFLDPHNRAAVLRTAEGLGIQEIHVIQPDGVWPLSRRVTQGCHKWLDVVMHDSVAPCADGLERRGYLLVEANETAERDAVKAIGPEQNVALCLGNEHTGLSAELRQRCRGQVGIPMRGFSRSLNVSVAAALLIRGLAAARRGGLAPADEEQLRARYYVLSVRHAKEVLKNASLIPLEKVEGERGRPGR